MAVWNSEKIKRYQGFTWTTCIYLKVATKFPKILLTTEFLKVSFVLSLSVIWLPQGQPNLANWWRGSWALFSKTQLIIGYCLFLDIGHQKPRGEYESQNPGKLSGIRYRNLILVWLSFPLCRRLQLDSVTLYVIKNLCFD